MKVRPTEGVAPTFTLSPEQLRLVGYMARLDEVYRAYDRAADALRAMIASGLCMERCGICCHTSVFSMGVEAEYAASYLLGQGKLKGALDRVEDWLTRRGKYTYGRRMDRSTIAEHPEEWRGITDERCCFLEEDSRCYVYYGRPLVCRAFGVSHQPGPNCPRPYGVGEGSTSGHAYYQSGERHLGAPIPLFEMVAGVKDSIRDRRYRREGFFATMLYERFRARELAGLVDDGRVPTLKLAVGIGGTMMMLWQEQLELEWAARAADESIATQVPLTEGEDHDLHMLVGAR